MVIPIIVYIGCIFFIFNSFYELIIILSNKKIEKLSEINEKDHIIGIFLITIMLIIFITAIFYIRYNFF